jgi:DNA-binding NarL/FixJ family response regulator
MQAMPGSHSTANGSDGERHAFGRLSERELEVLLLVAQGASNDAIAHALGISARTVHSHVAAAMKKTSSNSRTHLAVRAIRAGIAP